MSYSSEQRRCAVAWKRLTESLPEEGRNPAPFVGKNGRAIGAVYPFCLPTEFAAWNLLPEVRSSGLKLFADLGIPWHAGVSGGPGNHLLSSQVQCVNALGQMVDDPDRLAAAFGDTVEVGHVL